MRPLAVGQYINEVDAFLDPTAPQRCFSPAAWQRLAELRRRYDPMGVFHSWPGSGG
jgi:FAD/FMN-containing dehydrogenase